MPPELTGSPRRRIAAALRHAILALLIAAPGAGRPARAQAVAQPLWVRDSVRSEVLGETRYLRVALPAGYDAREYAGERFPVLLVLDAQFEIPFAAAVANARALAGTNSPATPRLLIVGVETPDANGTRFRDMTLPPADGTARRADGGGGAPAFLRFLSTELRPYLAARYRTHPHTVLAGHSLTGFFTVWAFGTAPDLVNGAVALSPTPHERQRLLDAVAGRTAPGRLFVLTGTAERGLDGATQSFVAALNARPTPGRAVEHQRLADVSHGHTAALGMVPGLRFVFRPVSLAGYQLEFSDAEMRRPLPTFTATFDSTRAAYLRGARELGLAARLPLGFLIPQSRFYQSASMAPLLLRLCDELTASYPSLWIGPDCAGDAQGRMGRTAEASASYRRALDAARGAGDSAAVGRLTGKVAGRP